MFFSLPIDEYRKRTVDILDGVEERVDGAVQVSPTDNDYFGGIPNVFKAFNGLKTNFGFFRFMNFVHDRSQ